jgi:hypothetical protein
VKRQGTRRQRLRGWLARRLWDLDDKLCDIERDDISDRLLAATEWLQKALCVPLGHGPVTDQCMIPDHDYCAWCNIRTPGLAERRT